MAINKPTHQPIMANRLVHWAHFTHPGTLFLLINTHHPEISMAAPKYPMAKEERLAHSTMISNGGRAGSSPASNSVAGNRNGSIPTVYKYRKAFAWDGDHHFQVI